MPAKRLTVDDVVYSFVKRHNPKFLKDAFSLERRIELLETSHTYKDITLVDLVAQYRKRNQPKTPKRRTRSAPARSPAKTKEVEGGFTPRRSARLAKSIKNAVTSTKTDVVKVAKKRKLKDESESNKEIKEEEQTETETTGIIESEFEEEEEEVEDETERRLTRRQENRRTERKHQLDQIMYKYLVDNGCSEILPSVFTNSALKRLQAQERKRSFPALTQVLYDFKLSRLMVDNDLIRVWMCKQCGCTLRGRAICSFRTHIGSCHIKKLCPCFISRCTFKANTPSALDKHLKQIHDISYTKDLSPDDYHKFRKISQDFHKTMDKALTEYFPMECFVGNTRERVKPKPAKIAKKKEQTCIQCGAVLKSFQGVRSHVASHLNLPYSCVLSGCSSTVKEPIKLSRHLWDVHKKRIGALNALQTQAYRIMREEFNGVLKEKMNNFFIDVKAEESAIS